MNIWPYGDHMHFLPWLWKMSLERQHWKYTLHTKKVVHRDLLTKIGVLSACIAYVPSPQDHMCWDDAYIEYYDTASFTVLGNSDSEESACNSGDLGLIPGSGRSPGEGNGSPLQYSCLENSMDRKARQAAIHEVTKSGPWLIDWYTHTRLREPFHTHDLNEFSW